MPARFKRRRRFGFRKRFRRRPTFRRKFKRFRPKFTNVHHYKRTYQLDNIQGLGAGGLVNKAYTFKLNQIPDVSDFTNLYSAYRINKVLVRVIPNFNTFVNTGTTINPVSKLPQIVDLVDYGNPDVLDQTNQYLQHANHRIHQGAQGWKRKFTPATTFGVKATPGEVLAGQRFKQWIDVGGADAEHLSYKLQLSGVANGTYSAEIFATLYFSCKQVR